jgi:hypothetical protein
MKRHRLQFVVAALIFVGALLASSSAFAQKSRSGGALGIGIGAATIPAGVSFKTATESGVSFQGVIGAWRGHGKDWRFGADSIGVAGDLLYEMPAIASGDVLSLAWNYGLGAGVGIGDFGGAIIGVTGVVGLEFNFVAAPIDVVLEYRPGLYIGDGVLDPEFVDFTPHIRFWF